MDIHQEVPILTEKCYRQDLHSKRPSFCLFAMTVSAAAMAMTSITGFTPSLVTEQGSSLANLNVVYLGIGITQIVFGAPAGILLDLPTINPHRSNIYFGLIILQGACTIGIGLAKSFSVVAAFLILQTIAHEAIYSQMSAAIGDYVWISQYPRNPWHHNRRYGSSLCDMAHRDR